LKYPKIHAPFKRVEKKGPDCGKLIYDDWSLPVFKCLVNTDWIVTEKIDGTNIRIIWDGTSVEIKGRTDNAQFAGKGYGDLYRLLTAEYTPERLADAPPCIIYGEGYGNGIQAAGGKYIRDGVSFAAFDVLITDGDKRYWATHSYFKELAGKLGIPRVPEIKSMTLNEAMHLASLEPWSALAGFPAEGYVLKHEPWLRYYQDRVICKVKSVDFAPGRLYYPMS